MARRRSAEALMNTKLWKMLRTSSVVSGRINWKGTKKSKSSARAGVSGCSLSISSPCFSRWSMVSIHCGLRCTITYHIFPVFWTVSPCSCIYTSFPCPHGGSPAELFCSEYLILNVLPMAPIPCRSPEKLVCKSLFRGWLACLLMAPKSSPLVKEGA